MISELMPHQEEFIFSQATHTGLVGGFGSGKSAAGTLKTLRKKCLYPGVPVAYYLPTYSLIKDIAYPNFEEALTQLRIQYVLNKGDREIMTPYGKIIFRSMDNPDTIVGYEVGYSLIDEADILPLEKMRTAFVKIAARNRVGLPDGAVNSIDMVSTPEGFNFLYEFFVKQKKANRKIIRGKTSDNKYLPETYIETLMDIYTEEQLLAYLNGEFVNLNQGTVYYKFDRVENHTSREVEPGDILRVGNDFNITNMCAVIHKEVGNRVYAVDEIAGAYDTEELCKIVKERYPRNTVVAYPDAAGAARSTSGSSDHQIMKNAGIILKTKSKNPSIRDRINTMNAMFCNANGERRYRVNTDKCPNYTEALEQLPYKNGVPDKSTGHDHITDGAGYFIHYRYGKTKATLSANQ